MGNTESASEAWLPIIINENASGKCSIWRKRQIGGGPRHRDKVWCRRGETQSHAPNQPNQIHTTPDTEPRRSRTKKTKADLLYLVQQATDTSSIFSNQTFQPVT